MSLPVESKPKDENKEAEKLQVAEPVRKVMVVNNMANENGSDGTRQQNFFKNGKKIIVPKKLNGDQTNSV